MLQALQLFAVAKQDYGPISGDVQLVSGCACHDSDYNAHVHDMCMWTLVGQMVEVTVAAGGDEEAQEDGEVVAGVDQRRGQDGTQADADRGEDERDEERAGSTRAR